MTEIIGIALAVACALTANAGFIFKHRGANAVPSVDILRPLWSGKNLFRARMFSIGMLIAAGSWLLHVGAMALIPLSIVQAVLAGGIVVLAIMAERMLGARVGRKQWLGLGMTGAGLLLLGLSLPPVHGAHSQFSLPGMITFEAGLLIVGALLINGPRFGAPHKHHGVMLGAAAGILFGVSDVGIKALTGLVGLQGPLGLLSPWLVVIASASVLAFFASAKSLQDGEPVPVIAITSTAANVSGIVGGFVVFGDPFPTHPLAMAVQITAFVLVLVAAWLTPGPARVATAAVA